MLFKRKNVNDKFENRVKNNKNNKFPKREDPKKKNKNSDKE